MGGYIGLADLQDWGTSAGLAHLADLAVARTRRIEGLCWTCATGSWWTCTYSNCLLTQAAYFGCLRHCLLRTAYVIGLRYCLLLRAQDVQGGRTMDL